MRTLFLLLALALVAAPAAGAEPLALVDETETLGPGVTLDHDVVLEPAGFVDRHVVTVDLTRRAVTSDLLSAPSVAQGSALSEQANAAGAVAGVNGDFFDIGNSNAALGFEVQGGALRKSGDRNGGQSFGVTRDGISQLLNLALSATATWNGSAWPLSGLNESAVPAAGIGAYTRAWGAYSRALLTGTATNTAEVWIADGRVTRAAQAPEGGTLPAGTTALVGSDAGADALRALAVGDAVALSYALSPAAASRLQFAVGTDVALVRDGIQRPDSETSQGAAGTSVAPRTAIGFKDGGRTLLLVTIDGPGGTGRGGVTLPKLAAIMHGLGAETAVNLDGGGSTTMVARGLGEPLATVRNVPSDGTERSDPNGVGVFVAPGSGRVEDLIVSPDGDEARVFPGLHLPLAARAVDDHLTPVALDERRLRWDTDAGSIYDAVLRAPYRTGSVRVRARAGRADGTTRVRVLGRLRSLELSSRRLSLPDLSTPATLAVTGRDAQGYAAAVDATDLELGYDESVVRVRPAAGGLEVIPLRTGATIVELRAAGETVKLPVTVGVETVELYRFDHADEAERWVVDGTAGQPKTLSVVPEGLKLGYGAQRNMGITKTPADTRIAAPGQPLRIRVKLTASVATQFANLAWYDADGVRQGLLIAGPQPGGNALEWTLPSATKFPIRIAEVQVIETRTAQQAPGEVVFEAIEADLAPELELPAAEPLRPDPLISPDGRFGVRDDWTFATLSDVQFTAANPELAKVAIAALARIRRARPDLVVLNGDIVDTGSDADVALARATLEQGGCDLIAVDAEPPAIRPPGTVPCYYVPGNHESYRADGSQGTLDAWVAEFGRPYRTFDHKGTRFVLLNSALGTLRSSGFDQLPMLEQALADARRDRSVRNVLVFAHHPVDDPDEKKASQLGDRREVELIKKLLADFRAAGGKGVAMIGSHAQIVDTHREEGVPYQVLPSSGKAPYGTPDRGGFTGYVRWSLDRHADAGERWLTADVRAFAQSLTLDAPQEVRAGRSAVLGGALVQPSGVLPGTRVVPLAYPMSVHWNGSSCLAIGDDEAAAQRAGKVAILDPLTRELTALRAGTVDVRVTSESMRELTDPESLEPITATRTIRVLPAHGHASAGRPRCETGAR